LLDVATIRGLKPTGETFDPSKGKSSMTFDFIKAACGPYIRHHHKPHDEIISDDEHISFLTYWLSMYIFCTTSI